MEPFKFTVKNVAKLLFGVGIMAGLSMGLLYLAIAAGSFAVELVLQGHYLIAFEAAVGLGALCVAYHWLAQWTLNQLVKYQF